MPARSGSRVFPPGVASYPAASLKDSKNAEAAAAFVAWLSGPEAQKILADAGFQKP
ncbi:extracellular solute-binding protein [Streptomyces sp. NPDC056387]|uniref:extracellular solute-binding protein n=1 Tax=Streptomyces sp. NPDC056387 TaxID=3345803 RepID=UPI0035DF5C79